MAPWVRAFFIKQLPKLLLMRVPKDLLKELATSKINYGMKNKLNAALAAHTQSMNSGASSPDSIRRMQTGGGCNGLHSTTATNRFSGLVGALGGGLSSLGGYNGLPSVMSGLDDSMSDLGGRKKYPFELEKAIHNVMFIQHHMQRMDEFNAEDQDWGFVAMVLDRLFLWLFTIASLAGLAILAEAPALYDDTKPIDIEYSIIAQKLFNLTKS